MGFFYNQSREQAAKNKSRGSNKHIPIASMNKMGCTACPLDKAKLKSGKMKPEGTDTPLIYILGEAPGEDEDNDNLPFAGKAGRLLKAQFSSNALRKDVRFSNVIRCSPSEVRQPTLSEVECCRNHGVLDIEQTKPAVVVGAGNLPLQWATGISGGIGNWRGRIIATKIGKHPCWYYPILHPSYVIHRQGKYGKSEYEKIFEYDLHTLQEMLRVLPDDPPHIYEAPFDRGIEYITGQKGAEDFRALEDFLNKLLKEPKVGLDIETSGLRPYFKDPKIHMAAIGTFDSTVAFSMDHPEGWSNTLRSKVWSLVGEFLIQSGRKICHHLAFEMEWLAYFYGERLLRITEWEDTLALAHTLNETPGTNSLDDLTREYFGFFLKDQSPVDVKKKPITDYPLMTALRYNGMDTKWTYLLEKTLQPLIQANSNYVAEYERKIRLAPTLVLSQLKGIPIDFDYAVTMNKTLTDEIKSIEGKISRCPEVKQYEKKFGRFEPTAPEQVLKLMRDICHRKEIEKANGKESSDEDVLSAIPADLVPSAPLIIEHRGAAKLKSTYTEPLVTRKLVGVDDLIHTSYGSMVAVTGRLQSQDPNMQNFPKRKRREIRGVVAAPDGSWMVAADYGQIEARVFGMASEDRNLVKYLWTNYDIHGFWADRFMQEEPRIEDRMIVDYKLDGDNKKAIRKAFRDEIKNGWVFPQFFGASTRSCARNLKVSEDLTDDLGREFWDEFQGVLKWQEKLLKFYDKHLYVETLGGRRRRGAMTKNEILNTPIQGTALDIVTAGMNALSELSVIEQIEELQPNMNIHDDLSTFVADSNLEDFIPIMATEMCRPRFDYINVPLLVEISIGARWNDLKEVEVYRSDVIFNLTKP